MNLKQEIIILKGRIAELEKELEKIGNEGEKKYPDRNTTVYSVNSLDEVYRSDWERFGIGREKALLLSYDSGKIFLTEEAAKEFAEVQRIEDELFVLADASKKWGGEIDHYTLQYAFGSDMIYYVNWTSNKMNVPYFESKESAMAAVETVGRERVIKWLTYQRKRPQM